MDAEKQHANTNQKKAVAAVTISDRADFKINKVIWQKNSCAQIKRSILQEDKLLSKYIPDNRASNCETKADRTSKMKMNPLS